jgi:hypothetical protein
VGAHEVIIETPTHIEGLTAGDEAIAFGIAVAAVAFVVPALWAAVDSENSKTE